MRTEIVCQTPEDLKREALATFMAHWTAEERRKHGLYMDPPLEETIAISATGQLLACIITQRDVQLIEPCTTPDITYTGLLSRDEWDRHFPLTLVLLPPGESS